MSSVLGHASSAVSAVLALQGLAYAAPAGLRGATQTAPSSAVRQLAGWDKFKLRWYTHQGKCLDVKDHGNYNGNSVQLWDCFENDDDQYWIVEDGAGKTKIRWASHPEKCLDVKDHDSKNGATLQIWDCDKMDVDQSFYFDNNDAPSGSENIPEPVGKLHWETHPSKCVDVKDHGDYDGNVIQVWDCLAGDADQVWIMDMCEGCPVNPPRTAAVEAASAPPVLPTPEAVQEQARSPTAAAAAPVATEVASKAGMDKFKLTWYSHSGKCLDVKDHQSYNGNTVQLWDCFDNDDDQYWMVEDGPTNWKIRWAAHPEKCLDVKDHDEKNGATLQIWDCEDGDKDQYFYLDNTRPAGAANIPEPVGKLHWQMHPNKCVDVKDHGDYNGNTFQIWDCFDGDDDQVWIMDMCEGCQ
jgi:hypothetical protein